MNLLQLRSEVLAHGFDPVQYGARVNQYLNDAMAYVIRRVDYYYDEAVANIATTAGTSGYPMPIGLPSDSTQTNFAQYPGFSSIVARLRSVFDTTRNVEMAYASQRQIDRSSVVSGAPTYYALDGHTLRLYPTPDGVYPIEVRYWAMPAPLVNDTDVPPLPYDWHRMLWEYAVARCYQSDDDLGTGGQWMQMFNQSLAEFEADQKFPDSDGPTQAADMWGANDALGTSNMWTRFPYGV